MVGWFPFLTDFPMTKPHCIAVWINHEKQPKTQVLSVAAQENCFYVLVLLVRSNESLTEEPMEL